VCRKGAWIELTAKVTYIESDSKQNARILIAIFQSLGAYQDKTDGSRGGLG